MTGPKAGDRISEYVLTELLGAGAFGQVWKAVHHIWKDRVVAVKIPTDSQYVRQLRREGVTLHGLKHRNIVRAIGLDPYGDPPYFVMEYVAGSSLRPLIDGHPQGLPIGAVRAVMMGVLAGLEHAHRAGVVHRDIKPGNILIAGDGTAESVRAEGVKITDFGLGRATNVTTNSMLQSESLLTEDGHSISGTLAYMSPEQREGGEVDERSDLYSLGVVLFEMVCGERPSGTETPGMIRTGLPAWVDGVFTRLYARRDRRYASASAVLESIEEIDKSASSVRAEAYRTLDSLKGEARNTRPHSFPPWGEDAAGRRCTRCGHRTEAEDNYCIHCGYQLAAERRCAQCRSFVQQDDRYCIYCGAPVNVMIA
jgi:serine/threonine protein kinase